MTQTSASTTESRTSTPSPVRRLLRSLRSPLGSRDLELDVIRGIAILLAMGWHLAGPTAALPVLNILFWPARTFGWAGVDLFFVLSGFLVGRLVLKEVVRYGSFDAPRFLLRRAFKLWPVYYCFLFAQLVFGENPPASYFWQSFFHLQNYLPTSFVHLWSLAVEEHFYLVFALILPLIIGRDWRFKPLMVAIAVTLIVPPALRLIAVLVSAPNIVYESQYRVDTLAAGVLLAALSIHRPALFERLLRMRILWAVLLAGAIAWLIVVPSGSPWMFTVGFSINAVGAMSAVLLVFRAGVMRRFSSVLRPLAVLGVYSYSLYLWHISVSSLAWRLALRVSPAFESPLLRILVEYTAAIVTAVVLTRLIEWPALAVRNRVMPGKVHAVRPAEAGEATLRSD